MSIRQDYEVADIGGGYGGFGGGGNILWWVLILVLVFLFFFRKDGDEKRGYGYGNDGCCSTKGNRPVFYDESNWEEETHIKDKLCAESEKTRGLIIHESEKAAAKEFQKQLAETAELKGKINTLEIEAKIGRLMGEVRSDYQKLACEIGCLPKAAPCFVESRPVCLQRCGEPRFDDFPRRCGE